MSAKQIQQETDGNGQTVAEIDMPREQVMERSYSELQ